jgi:NADH:ubiquinone oxidoreductase subunit H
VDLGSIYRNYFTDSTSLLMFFVNCVCYNWCCFSTLLEHNGLGYIHIHKYPNKIRSLRISQPFSDAIKLLSKVQYFSLVSNYLYYFPPVFSILLAMLM